MVRQWFVERGLRIEDPCADPRDYDFFYYGRFKICLSGQVLQIIFGHHGLYEIDLVDPGAFGELADFLELGVS